MLKRNHLVVLNMLFGALLLQAADASKLQYKALTKVAFPRAAGTWKIHNRDGANREVHPYLSSLGLGESGRGEAASPAFAIQVEKIAFTCCGHDGPQGERKKNFFALVDAGTRAVLRRTYAPGADPMQARSWDVKDLKGRNVRFMASDGDSEGAFAWIGIGRIDAGKAFQVDFTRDKPENWTLSAREKKIRWTPVHGGVPFQALASEYSMVAPGPATTVACGCRAERIFLLGCTVGRGRPLDVCGNLEIVYRGGATQIFPLMVGHTLDAEGKQLSPSSALHLHPSPDPHQYYCVIKPRQAVIETIKISQARGSAHPPRITAITVETASQSGHLAPLAASKPSAEEAAWIKARAIQPDRVDLKKVKHRIRLAHGMETGAQQGGQVLRFKRVKISDETYEAASVCDIDRDGNRDIVSGAFWYRGPDFKTRNKITEVKPAGEYWDDFSDYPMDVNGDGYMDIVVGAFFGGPLRWYENPKGGQGPWAMHVIANVGAIETSRFWDVDGDGAAEIVPNASGNVVFFRLVRDANGKGTGKFTRHVVKEGGCGHGLGFGDVNGDGRGDFIVPNGWIEAPADPLSGKWTWHDDGFRLGTASVPILVHDVNGDGKADLLVGQAHDYGLHWYEQQDLGGGQRHWTKHLIDPDNAQYHDMMLNDIDNDGKLELVTGKRYRAHNGHDPGSTDPLFTRYFDMEGANVGGTLIYRDIDYGPVKEASGVGIYFWMDDVDGNGWQDIVAPGKEGLYLFYNLGKK